METADDAPPHPALRSVVEWMGFTSADAKYQALVSVSEQEGWGLSEKISHYTSTSELSAAESEIFEIEASEVAALFWAYERYENLIGSMTAYFGEFADQERTDHAKFYRGDCQWSFDLAVGFMASVCGLPGPKCLSWVAKIVASQVRGGLYDRY